MPARTVVLAWQVRHARDEPTVTMEVADDGSSAAVILPGVVLPFDPDASGFPDVDEYLDSAAGPDVTVTVRSADLFAVPQGARLLPPWLEREAQSAFWISVDSTRGKLRGTARWQGHPDTVAIVACDATDDIRLGVDPDFLFHLAQAASEDVLTMEIHRGRDMPVRATGSDGFTALRMPRLLGVEATRPHFEQLLAELVGAIPDALVRDDDGDYPIAVGDGHAM